MKFLYVLCAIFFCPGLCWGHTAEECQKGLTEKFNQLSASLTKNDSSSVPWDKPEIEQRWKIPTIPSCVDALKKDCEKSKETVPIFWTKAFGDYRQSRQTCYKDCISATAQRGNMASFRNTFCSPTADAVQTCACQKKTDWKKVLQGSNPAPRPAPLVEHAGGPSSSVATVKAQFGHFPNGN